MEVVREDMGGSGAPAGAGRWTIIGAGEADRVNNVLADRVVGSMSSPFAPQSGT